MKILERYILKENIKPFLAALAITTFVMLFDRILDLLNLIIEKKLDILTIVKIFGLSLPFMLALTIPMAVLIASILSFGRLSVDNELIAFKSCGINIYTLLKPTMIAAFLLSLFMVYFNNSILPDTNHQLKNIMIKANYRRPITAIKPGIFNEIKKYTIYADEQKEDKLQGVIIYDRKESKYPRTISAKSGKIFLSNGGNSLKAVLYNGEIHKMDKKNHTKYEFTTFKQFTLNLPNLGYKINKEGSSYRGDRELSSKDMLERIEDKEHDIKITRKELTEAQLKLEKAKKDSAKSSTHKKQIRKFKHLVNIKKNNIANFEEDIRRYQVEIHKKYAIAFACLIFVLIGAPVGMMTKSSGVGMAFSVSSIVFMIYYAILTGGEELADKGVIPPYLAMWISNIILGIIGIYLVFISVKELKAIDLQQVITKYFKKIKKKFSK